MTKKKQEHPIIGINNFEIEMTPERLEKLKKGESLYYGVDAYTVESLEYKYGQLAHAQLTKIETESENDNIPEELVFSASSGDNDFLQMYQNQLELALANNLGIVLAFSGDEFGGNSVIRLTLSKNLRMNCEEHGEHS